MNHVGSVPKTSGLSGTKSEKIMRQCGTGRQPSLFRIGSAVADRRYARRFLSLISSSVCSPNARHRSYSSWREGGDIEGG